MKKLYHHDNAGFGPALGRDALVAIRKSKLSRYNVTLEREVKQTIEVEITARTCEEACDIAVNLADANPSMWPEGDVATYNTKAKPIK